MGSLSMSAVFAAAVVLSLAMQTNGHAFLSRPKARQVVWSDLEAPSNFERYPEGDLQSLAAGGPGTEKGAGHGFCGGTADAPHFTKPGKFGPRSDWWYVEKTSNYTQGAVMDVEVTVTAHHWGWFELRLCNPSSGEPVTQECFNQHILKFDRQHAEELYGSRMDVGFRGPADYKQSLLDTPSYRWEHTSDCVSHGSPEGSCCKSSGGTCSDPADNDDRWVLPKPASGGAYGGDNVYQIRYFLPADLTCERCVVQFYYQTGNSPDGYPEGFWNCADIRIGASSGGGTPAPTATTITTPQPTASVTISTPAPTAATTTPQPTASVTAQPTSSQRKCVSISVQTSDEWCQAVNCDPVYADFCKWEDDVDAGTPAPTTPAPTTPAPTPLPTASATETPAPTPLPTASATETPAPTASTTTGSPTTSSTCTCISNDPRASDAWCQATECAADYIAGGFCKWECGQGAATPAPTESVPVTTPAPTTSSVTTAAPTDSSPPPPPPPPPSGDFKLDIIGFHGNSGLAVQHIPLLKDIPCYYNVLIITFANFKSDGSMVLEMQGPYANDFEALKADMQVWKAQTDPYGRERRVLFSIGGQNGHWPDGLTEQQVSTSVFAFLEEYGFDGMDVDLEGDAVASASTLVSVIQSMRQQGYTVVASPEAAQGPLNAYKPIIPYLDYYHPQFYNNPTNAVVEPFTPRQPSGWASPPTHWQGTTPSTYDITGNYDGTPGQAWWLSVLDATSLDSNLQKHQRGMLVPAAVNAAGINPAWEYDFDKLATTITNTGLTHVGTWALAYDNEIGWEFSRRMAQTMGALQC